MFSRNDPPQPQAGTGQPDTTVTHSYIAAEVSIEGSLSCRGNLRFDGTIKGDLDCKDLTAGPHAIIDGTVHATRLSLNGKISGFVEAESVHLGPDAEMFGDIVYRSLSIDEGATFEGNLRRRSAATDDSATENPATENPATKHNITVLRRPG